MSRVNLLTNHIGLSKVNKHILYIYCMLVRVICCPLGIWYSWVNKFSYFLIPYAINVLLYRMKPRKHIHVKYCWHAYFKSIQINLFMVINICDVFRVPLIDNSGGKTREISEGWNMIFISRNMIFVITSSDFYQLSNQINLFMVINIWGIIIWIIILPLVHLSIAIMTFQSIHWSNNFFNTIIFILDE